MKGKTRIVCDRYGYRAYRAREWRVRRWALAICLLMTAWFLFAR